LYASMDNKHSAPVPIIQGSDHPEHSERNPFDARSQSTCPRWDRLEDRFDVIVAGGNVAGASTAINLASKGLRVVVVERRSSTKIGSRSCGDGIERYQFENLGLPIPKGEFLLRNVDRAYLNSPDRKVRLRGETAGIAIDRFGLNQYLVQQALDAGVQIIDRVEVTGPTIEDGYVRGVHCRPLRGGDAFKVLAPVTVDATGWRAQLRQAAPAEWPIAEVVPKNEMALAYREERRRPEPVEELLVEATFDFEIAPQGLYWVADRTETLVNVGIGMQWVPGIPNPRTQIRNEVLPKYPSLVNTTEIRSGAGVIPNRRPIDCPVGPGIVAIGDAACQVQPLTGSGIGASMYAAGLLAEVVTVALETTKTPSTNDLYAYGHRYHTTYGIDQAANMIFRMSLQALTNAQLNRLMSAHIVSEEELVSAARQGRLELSFGKKLKAATKLMGEPRLIKALTRMQSDMESARDLYSRYPEDPVGLTTWRREAKELFDRVPNSRS
jgi:flavin-dependent dehydrogenase